MLRSQSSYGPPWQQQLRLLGELWKKKKKNAAKSLYAGAAAKEWRTAMNVLSGKDRTTTKRIQLEDQNEKCKGHVHSCPCCCFITVVICLCSMVHNPSLHMPHSFFGRSLPTNRWSDWLLPVPKRRSKIPEQLEQHGVLKPVHRTINPNGLCYIVLFQTLEAGVNL